MTDNILPIQTHPNKLIRMLMKEFNIQANQIEPPENPFCPIYKLANLPLDGSTKTKPSVILECTCLSAGLINEYVKQNPVLKEIWNKPGVAMYPQRVGHFTRFTSNNIYYWRVHIGTNVKKTIQDLLLFPFTTPEYHELRMSTDYSLDQLWMRNFRSNPSYMVEHYDTHSTLYYDAAHLGVRFRPAPAPDENSDGEDWYRIFEEPPSISIDWAALRPVEEILPTTVTDVSSIIQAQTSAVATTNTQIDWQRITNNIFRRSED